MLTKIENARVFSSEKRKFETGSVFFEGGMLTEPSLFPDAILDAKGGYVLPGLIDVHTHGRCGIDIMESDRAALSALSLAYAKSGVTTVFPTVMTAPLPKLRSAITELREATLTADFAGIHIEGPYISPKKPGCHDVGSIRKPSKEELFALCESILPWRTHITVAPEEDESHVIEAFSERFGACGGTIGIGHTAADYQTCMDAVAAGAVSFTHTFNAMTPLLHREPGAVGAALAGTAYAECICDGIHVAPAVVSIAYHAKAHQGDRFVLITDSIPAAGLPDGEYAMNGIPFTLRDGKAARADGTIVGSALDLLTAVKNLAAFADIPFEEALICATKAPAEMVGVYDSRGSLTPGKRADVLICDAKMNLRHVFCLGKKIV